jgi:hypothetical protein
MKPIQSGHKLAGRVTREADGRSAATSIISQPSSLPTAPAVGQPFDGVRRGRHLDNVETAPLNLGSISAKHGIPPGQRVP